MMNTSINWVLPMDTKLKVFLCHSSQDKPMVREVYRRLILDGFDVWLDEEKLLPGQDWNLEIEKAVEKTEIKLPSINNANSRNMREICDTILCNSSKICSSNCNSRFLATSR